MAALFAGIHAVGEDAPSPKSVRDRCSTSAAMAQTRASKGQPVNASGLDAQHKRQTQENRQEAFDQANPFRPAALRSAPKKSNPAPKAADASSMPDGSKPAQMLADTPDPLDPGLAHHVIRAGASDSGDVTEARTQAQQCQQDGQDGGAVPGFVQKAKRQAEALVSDVAAADEASNAAQEQVKDCDAEITNLIKQLAATHDRRAAASADAYKKSARCNVLEDQLQHLADNTNSMLQNLRKAKRRKF